MLTNIAVNIGVHISFWVSVSASSRKILRSEIAGWCGCCISHFWRKFHTVFHSGCPNVQSHQQCARGPFSPNPHPALIVCCLFDDSHSDRCEVISRCAFDVRFFDDQWCWVSFHVSVISRFFGKMSFQVLCYFFNQIVCFVLFWCWLVWVLCILWTLTPYWMYHLQISSPIQ